MYAAVQDLTNLNLKGPSFMQMQVELNRAPLE